MMAWMCFFVASATCAQSSFFGAGVVVVPTIYERYENPHLLSNKGNHSSGSFMLNIPGLGGKVWLGGDEVKLSLEGRVHYAPAASNFDVWNEFTGLGALSFPVVAKFNVYGPEKDYFSMKPASIWTEKHWAIGAGVQFTRTDLYFQPDDLVEEYKRDWFKTYIMSIEYGVMWGQGLWVDGFVEYGVGEFSSSTFRIGTVISVDFMNLGIMSPSIVPYE